MNDHVVAKIEEHSSELTDLNKSTDKIYVEMSDDISLKDKSVLENAGDNSSEIDKEKGENNNNQNEKEFRLEDYFDVINEEIEKPISVFGEANHKFEKDKPGKVLFFLVYFFIAIESLGVYICQDFRDSTWLYHYKWYFIFVSIMAIWSHIKAGTQNPGKIVHYNNENVINFYLNVRDIARKNGQKMHDKLGHVFFKKRKGDKNGDNSDSDDDIMEKLMFLKKKKEGTLDPEEEESFKRREIEKMERKKKREEEEKKKEKENPEESDISSVDSQGFRPLSAIGDEAFENIMKTNKIDIKRCKQCYVIRYSRAHHCSKCHGYFYFNIFRCIMKMDNHCPWINNCVGQFSQKFFLLFLWYAFSGTSTSLIIGGYYNLYRNYNE
jgi:hypothetical protein